VGSAWRHRVIVSASILAFLAAGLIYAEARGPVYSAIASLVLEDPHSAPVFANPDNEPTATYIADQVNVLKSPDVALAAAVAGTRGSPPVHLSATYFSAHTSLTDDPLNGNLVQITFIASDATTALAGIDAFVTGYESVVRAAVDAQLSSVLSQLDTELTSINAQLLPLQARLAGRAPPDQQALVQQEQALLARAAILTQKRDQVAVDVASPTPGVAQYLPAQSAVHTPKLVAALPILSLTVVVGLLIGVAAAYVLAFRRRAFLTRTEPEAVLNAPMVGEIPRFDPSVLPLPTVDAAASAAATAFRGVALFIQVRHTEGQTQRLAVVSTALQQDRGSVAANLAVAVADSGLSILLVDADPVSGRPSDLLRARFESIPIHNPASLGAAGLALEDLVLPPHVRGRLALLRLDQTQPRPRQAEHEKVLAELGSGFDVVLVDPPPMSDVGADLPLVRYAAGALVIVAEDSPVASLQEAARLLNMIDLPVVGYVYTHPARFRRTIFGSRWKAARGERFEIEYRPVEGASGPRSELSA
jgi:Mrp family chromosome partitioning ATPase